MVCSSSVEGGTEGGPLRYRSFSFLIHSTCLSMLFVFWSMIHYGWHSCMHHMQFAVFKDVNEEQLGIWESLGSMII